MPNLNIKYSNISLLSLTVITTNLLISQNILAGGLYLRKKGSVKRGLKRGQYPLWLFFGLLLVKVKHKIQKRILTPFTSLIIPNRKTQSVI